MAAKILFNKRDWYDTVEAQTRALKAELDGVTDEQALDELFTQRMKERYLLHIPTLYPDQMTFDEVETERHKQGRHSLPIQMAARAEIPTELVFYIPFDGDPAVFDIRPSAITGNMAQGEIVGHDLLIKVQPPNQDFDINAYLQREIGLVNWRLDNLRHGLPYLDQQLEGARRAGMAERKRRVQSRFSVTNQLNIPRRQPQKSPPVEKAKQETVYASPPIVSAVLPSSLIDVFVSHAWEDKDYVRPLVEALKAAGVTVWFDEMSVGWGDDLRQKIDEGLLNCRFGIVVFSKAFLKKKKWTEYEVSALFSLETTNVKKILPIWHNVSAEDILRYSPALSGRLGLKSMDFSIVEIVAQILNKLGRAAPAAHVGTPKVTESGGGWRRPELIAYAAYKKDGLEPEETKLSVYRSLSVMGNYTIVDGQNEHDGTAEDVGEKLRIADHYLRAQGYIRTAHGNPAGNPLFNLGWP